MKVLSAEQIRELDAYTIRKEPIASIDLMERAAETFVDWFINQFPDTRRPVVIFCGPGNNGGDGLAAARLLYDHFYQVQVFWCRIGQGTSSDFSANLEKLPDRSLIPLHELNEGDPMPEVDSGSTIIDAIFGSGLNRPVSGYWGDLLQYLNGLNCRRVAIDIPSGVFADRTSTGQCFQADYTLSFELPKLAFFFPENSRSVGAWTVRSIRLSPTYIERTNTPFQYVDEGMVKKMLRPRHKFDHKGTFGHALLVMGSQGSIGAAILASRACLRSGAGLVTVHAPKCGYGILQISVPEAMVSIDRHEFQLSEIPDLDRYSAIGVGCGIGQKSTSVEAVRQLLTRGRHSPMVIDADALNIIAQQADKMDLIPPGSVLTPHPKEFERLFGSSTDDFARCALQRRMARQLGIFIVLKGAHTAVACPDGTCYFNSTGNPGMATGGSGDVLTGIISGLLTQGYPAREAAILGVYLHGLAGDLAAAELEHESLIAGDLVQFLGHAFHQLTKSLKK